jgi:hypothetical protein
LQVLVILLVAIVALYVVVVLLGFVGIHVPVPGFDDARRDLGAEP